MKERPLIHFRGRFVTQQKDAFRVLCQEDTPGATVDLDAVTIGVISRVTCPICIMLIRKYFGGDSA